MMTNRNNLEAEVNLELFEYVKKDFKNRDLFTNERLFEIEQFLKNKYDDVGKDCINQYDKVLITYINLLTKFEQSGKNAAKHILIKRLEDIFFVIRSFREYRDIIETDKIIGLYHIESTLVEVINSIKFKKNTQDDIIKNIRAYRSAIIDILALKIRIQEAINGSNAKRVQHKNTKKTRIIDLYKQGFITYKQIAEIADTSEQYVKNTIQKFNKKRNI